MSLVIHASCALCQSWNSRWTSSNVFPVFSFPLFSLSLLFFFFLHIECFLFSFLFFLPTWEPLRLFQSGSKWQSGREARELWKLSSSLLPRACRVGEFCAVRYGISCLRIYAHVYRAKKLSLRVGVIVFRVCVLGTWKKRKKILFECERERERQGRAYNTLLPGGDHRKACVWLKGSDLSDRV